MTFTALECSYYTFSKLSRLQLFQIFKLRTDVFVVEQNCAYPEIDDDDLSCLHVCIYQKDSLIAYCRLIECQLDHYKAMKIGRVLVRDSARGQGVGRILLNKALSYIIALGGYERAILSGQSHLVDFYRHHGFEVVSDCYLEDGIEHVDMQKPFDVDI